MGNLNDMFMQLDSVAEQMIKDKEAKKLEYIKAKQAERQAGMKKFSYTPEQCAKMKLTRDEAIAAGAPF